MSPELMAKTTALTISALLLLTRPSHAIFDYCRKAQCRSGQTHTVCSGCRKASNVKPIPTTAAFRTAILDEHNQIRDLIASGKNATIGLPSASNMRALSYDLDLEYTVTCWLHKSGKMQHDVCRSTEKFDLAGQNLMDSNHYDAYSDTAQREAPRRWVWDEAQDMSPEYLPKFNGTKGKVGIIGHLTQELWALTTHIGCAMCYVDSGANKKYMVGCNYGPAGNTIGLPIYLLGEPASKCPDGTSPNAKYVNLCGNIEPVPTGQITVTGHSNRATYVTPLLLVVFMIFL